MNVQVRYVDVDVLRYVARLATNIEIANNLLQDARTFAHADGFSDQAQGNSRFNLLALHQALEVRMDQAAAHRIDLAIDEHHFVRAHAFHVERENRVATRVRSQDGSEFARPHQSRDRLTLAAVNRYRHLPVATCAS